jgi:hypothetical protein
MDICPALFARVHALPSVNFVGLVGVGRTRQHPKAQPTRRSLDAARDYLALLERLGVDDAGLRVRAETAGVALQQSTLSRLRNAALPNGPSEATIRAIAAVVGEPAERVFPSLYTTGDNIRDEVRNLLTDLSADQLVEALRFFREMLGRDLTRDEAKRFGIKTAPSPAEPSAEGDVETEEQATAARVRLAKKGAAGRRQKTTRRPGSPRQPGVARDE